MPGSRRKVLDEMPPPSPVASQGLESMSLNVPKAPSGSRPGSARPGSASSRRPGSAGPNRSNRPGSGGRGRGGAAAPKKGRGAQGAGAAAARLLNSKVEPELEELTKDVCFFASLMTKRRFSAVMRNSDGLLPLDICGHDSLRPEELQALMALPALKRAVRVLLQPTSQVSADLELQAVGRQASDLKTFILFAEGQLVRARLPTLVQVGRKSLVEAARRDIQAARDIYKDFSPVVEGSFIGQEAAALELSLSGGRCCLPQFVEEFTKVAPMSKLYLEAIGDENGVADRALFLSLTQQLFGAALPEGLKASRVVDTNLFEVFGNLDGLLINGNNSSDGMIFGPSYYDGGGAAQPGAESVEQYGPLWAEGNANVAASEMTKLVAEVVGKPQRPSDYLLSFHKAMEQEHHFWKTKCLKRSAHGSLSFDDVWQDRDGRIWIAGAGAANKEVLLHAFTDPASWLAEGLFLHTPIDSSTKDSKDETHLRTLILYLAGVPEQLEMTLPPPPADCSSRVLAAWGLSHRMIQHFAEYALHPPGTTEPSRLTPSISRKLSRKFSRVSSAFDEDNSQKRSKSKSDLMATCGTRLDCQFLWAMFHNSIRMVGDPRTRMLSERKRLALYASLAFAARLWAITGKATEPKRMAQLRAQWRTLEVPAPINGDMVPALYLKQAGSTQGWVHDPVVQEKLSVAEEPAKLEANEDVTMLVEDGTEVATSERVELSILRLRELWQEKQRLVLRGAAGTGKATAMQGALVELIQAQVEQGDSTRLPLRVGLADLIAAEKTGSGDLLQEYAHATFGDNIACALAWERLPVTWRARSYAQVTTVKSNLVLTGGLSAEEKPLREVWISPDGGRSWEELPTPPWLGRYGHQVVLTQDTLLLTGGMGDDGRRLRDAWASYDCGATWQELPIPRWSGRYFHKAVIMELQVPGSSKGALPTTQEYVVVLGGNARSDKGGDLALRDAWASNNGGYSWHELQEPPWPARFGHQAIMFQHRLYVVCGTAEGGKTLQDVWCLSGEVWPVKGPEGKITTASSSLVRWEEKRAPPFHGRTGHQVAIFRGNIIVAGGSFAGDPCDDAWSTSNGATWQQLDEATWAPITKNMGHTLASHDGRLLSCGGGHLLQDVPARQRVANSILRCRDLALIIDDFDEPLSGHGSVVTYLQRLLESEPQHMVMLSMRTNHVQLKCHDLTLHECMDKWAFTGVDVHPFGEQQLKVFCERRLGELSRPLRDAFMEQVLNPSCREIMTNSLAARIVLRFIASAGADETNRCDFYKVVFEHFCQSLRSAKSHETTEFIKHEAVGMDAAIAELAFEVQSRGGRAIIPRDLANVGQSEGMELMIEKARGGHLVLFSTIEDTFQMAIPSMQEFLAAKHLWRRLGTGEPLPAWILKEGSASDSLLSCAKFFGTLAAVRGNFQSERFVDLREGFGTILRSIAQAGDAFAAKCLLQVVPDAQSLLMSADAEVQNQHALHVASIHGHAPVARALLEFAADRRALSMALDASGSTALHCAARSGHVAVAKVLLGFSADREVLLSAPDGSLQNYTPLHVAAISGHDDVIKALLEMASDRNDLLNQTDMPGSTALHCAAEHGHEGAIRVLLAMSLNPEGLLTTVNHHDMQMALHLAAWNGQASCAHALLELAPHPAKLLWTPDRLGQMPLHLAAERGHQVAVEALLNFAQDPAALLDARERLTGQTALHMAADAGHEEVVRVLLKYAPDKDALLCATDSCGKYTALHLAAEKGRAAAVRALLETAPDRGALLDKMERFAGQLPLHLAAANGHDEVVRILLENSPDRDRLLQQTDRSGGFTALHLAVEKDHAAVAQALLEQAPERWPLLTAIIERWCGFSALHLAAYKGYEAAASVLIDFAPVRKDLLAVRDRKGRTAAELASDRGNRAVLALLTHDTSH